jgi:phosphopantothenoylcysteine synthetase/decarboxylase
MKILVTAGNTQAPIDRVRCLTNIFTGRTGGNIFYEALVRGHQATLLTSAQLPKSFEFPIPGVSSDRWQVRSFRTFDELHTLMAESVVGGAFDALVHSAAVSDYLATGVYSPAGNTQFRANSLWISTNAEPPALVDRAASKIKSDEAELWIRLVRAPKLIDLVRSDWRFGGVLVKFKLEVGVGDEQLLDIAEQSRRHSDADLMVANTLEAADSWALLGPVNNRYERVVRVGLARRLLEEVERVHKERCRG